MNVEKCESWITVLGDLGIKSELHNLGDGSFCVSINHDSYHKLIAIEKLFGMLTCGVVLKTLPGTLKGVTQYIIDEAKRT